ncbi:MAG TPA: DUF374 domain-containing protein [Candidatus Saccharimonadales bacterium]|nr:DUF374 domain-containing protein [Candidatus Saccharimonadales bacterium]
MATIKRDPRFSWFWRLLSPAVAGVMLANAKLMLFTSVVSIRRIGPEYSGAAVYVNWHKYALFLCIHHGGYGRVLLMSSAPYMEPVARWCGWLGVTVVRGNPGERSRESLVRLIECLQRGESVCLAADGPAGPPFKVKTGCVELARAAGVPIVPLAYRSRKGKSSLERWDQRYTVGKFDQIEVVYGGPIFIGSSEAESSALERVRKGLDEVMAYAQENPA